MQFFNTRLKVGAGGGDPHNPKNKLFALYNSSGEVNRTMQSITYLGKSLHILQIGYLKQVL